MAIIALLFPLIVMVAADGNKQIKRSLSSFGIRDYIYYFSRENSKARVTAHFFNQCPRRTQFYDFMWTNLNEEESLLAKRIEMSICFEESEYEKLRKERIEENERKLRELFPELSNASPGCGLLRSPRKSDSRPPPPALIVKWPIKRTRAMKIRRGSCSPTDRISTRSLRDRSQRKSYAEIEVVGLPIKRKRCSSVDPPSPRRMRPVIYQKSVDEITEEDLMLIAEKVSEKRYDSIDGTSCHQCRQKTDDMKTVCRSGHCVGIRGQFCGPCLKNRYGEDAREAVLDPDWQCPPCRGICNCSFCMKKRGRRATGILIHTARECGYHDVNAFLGLSQSN